jgi:type VI secretion system protein
LNQGLIENVLGQFSDGTSIDDVPFNERYIFSIRDHLSRLFNTRKGSLSHLPEYGLPDISTIYSKMPQGARILQNSIKAAIQKYEFRLKNITVTPIESDNPLKLVFMISGQLTNGSNAKFRTTFTTLGNSFVTPCKALENYD